MSKRILGRDLEVSSIGLGCIGMSHAYGRPSDKTEAQKLQRKSFEERTKSARLQRYRIVIL